MPKFPKDKKEYLKSVLSKVLIRDPNLTCRKAAKILNINKDTANKLLKELREDNAERLKKDIEELRRSTIEEEVIKMEIEFQEVIRELWEVIREKKSSDSHKIRAIKTLVDTRIDLFNLKLKTGLLEKKKEDGKIPLIELFQEVQETKNEV